MFLHPEDSLECRRHLLLEEHRRFSIILTLFDVDFPTGKATVFTPLYSSQGVFVVVVSPVCFCLPDSFLEKETPQCPSGSKVTSGSSHSSLLGSGVTPLSVVDSGQPLQKKDHMVEVNKIASADTYPGEL